MVTPKLKAKVAISIAAVLGTISQVNALAPSLQDKFVQSLQAVFPVAWRPEIVAICGFLTAASGVYALIQASHSGPATKPATDPQTGEAAPSPAPATPTTPRP